MLVKADVMEAHGTRKWLSEPSLLVGLWILRYVWVYQQEIRLLGAQIARKHLEFYL